MKEDMRQRIKLLGGNFDKQFNRNSINKLFSEFGSDTISREQFELFLLFATHAYLDIKNIKLARRSIVATAEKFAEFAKHISAAQAILKTLDKEEQNSLISLLNGINSLGAVDLGLRAKLTQGKPFYFPKNVGETTTFTMIEAKSFIAGLQWLETCARMLVRRGEAPLPGGQDIRLKRRDSNDHIDQLVEQVRDFWKRSKAEPFTRQFMSKGGEPLSSAAIFCVNIARHIDPAITPQQMDSSMKKVITADNRRRRTGK